MQAQHKYNQIQLFAEMCDVSKLFSSSNPTGYCKNAGSLAKPYIY